MKISINRWVGAAVLTAFAAGPASAAGTLFVGSSGDGADAVSVRDSETLLSDGADLALSGPLGGVVAGNNDDLYITVGDTLSNLSLAGGTLNSISEAGNEFTDATVFANQVVLAVDGAAQGFSFRDLSALTEILFVPTTCPVESINDGYGRLCIR